MRTTGLKFVCFYAVILVAAALQAHGVESRDSLRADTDLLYTPGGQEEQTLNAGSSHAGQGYVVLGSFSGTDPGTILPGGGVLPLNWDTTTSFIRNNLNSVRFVDFLGSLDASGGATAMLNTLGPLPPSIQPGSVLSLAFTTYSPFDFQSNPVNVVIEDPPVIVYVDDSNTTGIEDGSMAHPYNTIQEGISAAQPGEQVHVDDSGVIYSEAVVLKDGVLLVGGNWDPSDGTPRPQVQSSSGSVDYTVTASGVNGAGIVGFDILPGGTSSYYIAFVGLINSTDILVSDCYFNGNDNPYSMTGVLLTGCSGVEISWCHFDHIHGPEPGTTSASYWCILGDTTSNLHLHNTRMNDIGTNLDPGGHTVDAVLLTNCDDAVIHNNLVYNIVAKSGGAGASLVTGFKLTDCSDPILYNNTVDTLDTTDNFFINQAFGYFIEDCLNAAFYNNMATNILSSGFPPPLARGIQGVTNPLPCDFTLTWNIAAAYYGTAYANNYCVSSDPLYLDPQNGDHDIAAGSSGQLGDPYFVDWDDPETPSGDPGNPDIDRRARMGCHGGPDGETVGLLTSH